MILKSFRESEFSIEDVCMLLLLWDDENMLKLTTDVMSSVRERERETKNRVVVLKLL